MIDLIKFELHKIFSRKSVLILMLLTIVFAVMNIRSQVITKHAGFDNLKEVQKVLEPYEGRTITEEESTRVGLKRDEAYKKRKRGEELTREENMYLYYLNDYMLPINPTYRINGEMYKASDIKTEIEKLKNEGKTDTFEYKNLEYIYGMVSEKETPTFNFKDPWTRTTDFNVIATLTSTLVAIGIATIFSNEYQSNSSAIILSSKNGRTKLVTSKILAGAIYTLITFVIVNGIYFMSTASIGLKGGDLPLNFFGSYSQTPFDMTMNEFYITGLAVSFIGLLLYAILVMLISLVLRNNMLSLLIGIGIYYVPVFVANLASSILGENIGKILREINISEAIRIQGMFRYISTYNIFGEPVLYLTVLTTLVAISIPIVIFLLKYFGKKQEI